MDEQTERPGEIWQAEIEGTIRSLSLEEMAALISTGMLLPMDKVRRGNLRWLEAGRVPALAAYFAGQDVAEPAANEDLKYPLTQPEFSEAAAPQTAVSSSPLVKSFVYVLLLSLVFTYLWMYYRDAKDRTERAAAAPEARADSQSMTEVEASYEKRKKFLTDQRTRTERVLARIEAESKQLSATPNYGACYQYTYPDGAPEYSFDNEPPRMDRELDSRCVEQQRQIIHQQAERAEKDRKRMKEDLLTKRTEILAEIDELESDTESERARLTEGFYMAATKGRFYYGFIPIFLVLIILNTTRIIFKKKIAQPLRQLN